MVWAFFGFGHEDKHVHKLVRATDREKNHGVFDELVLGRWRRTCSATS